MIIEGTITRKSTESVNVNPSEVIKKLKNAWMVRCGVNTYWYLDTEGFWESWQDTHGSGIYDTHRKATEEEVVTWQAFEEIERLATAYK